MNRTSSTSSSPFSSLSLVLVAVLGLTASGCAYGTTVEEALAEQAGASGSSGSGIPAKPTDGTLTLKTGAVGCQRHYPLRDQGTSDAPNWQVVSSQSTPDDECDKALVQVGFNDKDRILVLVQPSTNPLDVVLDENAVPGYKVQAQYVFEEDLSIDALLDLDNNGAGFTSGNLTDKEPKVNEGLFFYNPSDPPAESPMGVLYEIIGLTKPIGQ
jgi:hypothetical protein